MNVMITGAAGGLGRVLADACAKRGFNLFLTDINASLLYAIRVGICRRYDVEVWTEVCDLTSAFETERLFKNVADRGIQFDMLLNVAGVDFEGSFMGRSAAQIAAMVQLNIAATLHITHKALQQRESDKKFYIVFVSSLASLYPMPLKACYAASKRFLYDFSYALGNELRAQNVSVLALCPGGLPTNEEAIRGIAAQGFWGSVTTNRLEIISRRTISKVMQGKRIYIPGLLNRIMGILGSIIPKAIVSKIIYARWQSARASRSAAEEL